MNAPRTNISGIARAGRSASSTYGNIADTARKYGPRYDEMAVADVKARSQEKQAAIIAERNVRAAEAKAENLLERTEIEIDTYNAKRAAAKTSRKAGMVAAAGKLAAIGLEKPEEPIRPIALNYDKQTEALTKRLEDDDAIIEAGVKPYTGPTGSSSNEEQAGDNSPSDQSTTLTSKSGGQPAGKVSTTSAWSPLSAVIRHAEGTSGPKGYTTMFGGRQFTDMSRHPNNSMSTPWGTQSEAAGAYQFMKGTWDETAGKLGLKDFSVESQEKAGRYLAEGKRGVDLSKRATNLQEFTGMMDKLAPEWASLPASYKGGKSHYGQPSKDLNELWEIYQRN